MTAAALASLWALGTFGVFAAAGVGLGTLGWLAINALDHDYDPEREKEQSAARDDELVPSVVITERPVSLRRGAVRRAVLHRETGGLALTFPFGRSSKTLVGTRAERAAASMLAHLNTAGAQREFVDRALDRLVAAGSAEAFLRQVTHPGPPRAALGSAPGGLSIGIASAQTRLALEIALNEESERVAMEGALAALEQAWRDAEAIAAIADGLIIPTRVQAAFARLRAIGPGRAG